MLSSISVRSVAPVTSRLLTRNILAALSTFQPANNRFYTVRSFHYQPVIMSTLNSNVSNIQLNKNLNVEKKGKPLTEIVMMEHRTVEQLFSQFSASLNMDEKQTIANMIIRELSLHAAKEEMVMYPFIKSRLGKEGADLVEHSIDEHQGVKNLLYELDQMKVSDAGYVEKMNLVIKEVSHHVKEEEQNIFPKLDRAMSREENIKLGQEFLDAESKAPPRPHPSAPAHYPLNVAANMFGKVLDEGIRGASDTRKTSQI